MNADLQKITSLVTAIKMAEKEYDKQATKEQEAKIKEAEFQTEKTDLTAKIAASQEGLAKALEDEELKALTAEYTELEKTVAEKAEEKTLIDEIDELKKKIQVLEKVTTNLTEDVESIKV